MKEAGTAAARGYAVNLVTSGGDWSLSQWGSRETAQMSPLGAGTKGLPYPSPRV